jgi:hypothetical protein
VPISESKIWEKQKMGKKTEILRNNGFIYNDLETSRNNDRSTIEGSFSLTIIVQQKKNL